MVTLHRGFTLIEMIMVIVISSIIALTSVQFIVFSMQGVADISSRQKSAFSASLVSERISREIRQALPNSIRPFAKGGSAVDNCVEFVPVTAASRYLEPMAGTDLPANWQVISPGAVSGYVAVYPVSAGVIYPNGDNTAITQNTVTFPAGNVVTANMNNHTFPADSPERRFFVTAQPVSFCGEGGFIYRYKDYGFSTAGSRDVESGDRETFINGLSSVIFRYAPSTLTRNGVVTMQLEFENTGDGSEPILLNQQVQVRNVP